MAICPICERSFDELAYQLVIRGVGTFDSVACAEEALRRHRRRGNGELAADLLDSITRRAAGSGRRALALLRAPVLEDVSHGSRPALDS